MVEPFADAEVMLVEPPSSLSLSSSAFLFFLLLSFLLPFAAAAAAAASSFETELRELLSLPECLAESMES